MISLKNIKGKNFHFIRQANNSNYGVSATRSNFVGIPNTNVLQNIQHYRRAIVPSAFHQRSVSIRHFADTTTPSPAQSIADQAVANSEAEEPLKKGRRKKIITPPRYGSH